MKTNLPQIAWYAKFQRVILKPDGKPYAKPTYYLKGECGYHKPIEGLRNKRGGITLYLLSKDDRKNGKTDSSTPDLYLQTSGGYNFSGIKFSDAVPNPYAFGEPNPKATFTGEKTNPFYPENTDDCFLMLFSDFTGESVPDSFEVMVIPKLKAMGVAFRRMLADGKFNMALNAFREQSTDNPLSLV